MAKKKLTKEEEREIKYLQANNEMLERTKEEAKLRGTENSVKRIEIAQEDVYAQMDKIDPSLSKKLRKESKNNKDNIALEMIGKDDSDTVFDALDKAMKTNNESENDTIKVSEENSVNELDEQVSSNETSFNNIDSTAQYDIISLPSNGECYKSKLSRIPVGYLTAYDENFITSPNLYKDGLIIDFLLKNKIMNKNINIDELCSGDVDAITLFLRETSYGPDFPIVVKDPQTEEQIETTVDLSKLKYKEFTLKGDDNGNFEFILPLSKDKVKFKFLTRRDEKQLTLLNTLENKVAKSSTIINDIDVMNDAIKTDKNLSGKEKQEYIGYLTKISNWAKNIVSENNTSFTKTITNRLEMSIVSINENTDRKFIASYVKNMNAMDSLSLRRYMINNEPGVDFQITVNRPESLGGGSFNTFLEWDDSVFLNI